MSDPAARPAAELLHPALAQAEQGFLAAGRNLERAVAALQQTHARFTRCVAALTGDELAQTGASLAEAGRHVAQLAQARDAEAAGLAELADTVAAIARRLTRLLPLTQEVSALGINARVLAAGLQDDAFLGFTAEIRHGAAATGEGVETMQAELARLDRTIAATQADAAGSAQDAMQRLPQRFAAHAHSLRARQDRAGQAASAARQQALAAERDVAEQIVALQLGDITRQRLEHVLLGLPLLNRASGLAARVLGAQLGDAAAVLQQQGDRIEAGLAALAATAHALGALGGELLGDARRGDFVATLEQEIGGTTQDLARLRAADAAGERRMQAVTQAAAALIAGLARLRSVDEDLRLIGLNACFRCGRLGAEGRPLAAVAQALRACSRRFAEEADKALPELERLRAIAGRLCDPQRAARHAALAAAAEGMLAALRRLDALEQDLAAGLAALRDEANAVSTLVDGAVAEFAVRGSVAEAMRRTAAMLGAMAAESAADEASVLRRIAASYTMQCERAVHAGIAPFSGAAAGDSAAEDLQDVLF
jgi:hypothetical protein